MKPLQKLVLVSMLIGTVAAGCGPFAEPRAPIGGVFLEPVPFEPTRRESCYYFFREFFGRIDRGGGWSASYARARYIKGAGIESVDATQNSRTDFFGSRRAGFVSGDIDYTLPTGARASNRVIIRRSGSISENDTAVGGGQDLVGLRCMVVGPAGWLIQGFYVDPDDALNTTRTYQWATSFAFVPGPSAPD